MDSEADIVIEAFVPKTEEIAAVSEAEVEKEVYKEIEKSEILHESEESETVSAGTELSAADDFTMEYDTTNKTVTITGSSKGSISDVTRIDIPSTVNFQNNTYTVTKIKSYAFSNASSLSSVTLPGTIKEIQNRAFQGTAALKNIMIPKSLEAGNLAFYNGGLETISFEEGMEKIPGDICYNARNLKKVSMPDTVTEIGNSAFCNCTSLDDVTFSNNLKKIGAYAFSNASSLSSVTLPGTIKEIQNRAFQGTAALKNIMIPKSLEAGDLAFYDGGLETISFEEGMEKIPGGICINAKNLKTVSMPDTVTEIGNQAFDNCTSLDDVYFSYSLTKIGQYAFEDCPALKRIVLPSSLTEIQNRAFYVNATTPVATEVSLQSSVCAGSYEWGKSNRSVTDISIDIKNCIPWIEYHTISYNGTPRTPSFNLAYHGNNLTDKRDYIVTYENNVNAGTATATFTGRNLYYGTKTMDFAITPIKMSDCTVEIMPNVFTYSGETCNPVVTVSYKPVDGERLYLEDDKDYTLEYADNINAGTAKVILKAKEGNYTGERTDEYIINPASIKEVAITMNIPEYIFDYAEKKPLPEKLLYLSKFELLEGRDYTISYENNVNAGTAKVLFTGIGNYKDVQEKTFTIKKAPLSLAAATLSQDSFKYDGSAKKPGLKIDYKGHTLVADMDYTLNYSNNTNAGTASAVATGKGNFEGELKAEFAITPIKVDELDIRLSQDSYEYDGTEKKPAVSVKYGDMTLTEGVDYDVIYSNNVNVGLAKVSIVCKGNFTGSKDMKFGIRVISISTYNISIPQTSYEFSGKEIKPEVTVSKGAKTLTEGTDYTLSYVNNKKLGTASVIAAGIGNYQDTVSTDFIITMGTYSLTSDCTVSVNSAGCIYDGTEKKPSVSANFGDMVLTEGEDYTVTYSDNVNAGTGHVKVSGKGHFVGDVWQNFEIAAADITEAKLTVSPNSFTYDGNEKKPTVSVNIGARSLVEGTDYTLSYVNNKKLGTASVIAAGIGNYQDTVSTDFIITMGTYSLTSDCTVSVNSAGYIYDGTEKKPSVSANFGDMVLTEGEDYTVTYSDNVNAGPGHVKVSGKGHFTGDVWQDFEITAADITQAKITVSPNSFTYDGNEKKPTVSVNIGARSLVEGTDYTLSYENNTNTGKAKAKITGTGNYKGDCEAEFIISEVRKPSTPDTQYAAADDTSSLGGQSSGNIGKLTLTSVSGNITVLKGTKASMTNVESASSSNPNVLKAFVRNKKGVQTLYIQAKTPGKASLTFKVGDGQEVHQEFTVEAPKGQKKTLSVGAEPVVYSIKDLFNTNITSGNLTIKKQKGVSAVVDTKTQTITVTPIAKGSVAVEFKYLNKKFKASIKAN